MTRPLSSDARERDEADHGQTDMGMPRSHSAATPPDSASGTAVAPAARRGCAERRVEQQKDTKKQAGTTIIDRARAAAGFSNAPMQSSSRAAGSPLFDLRARLFNDQRNMLGAHSALTTTRRYGRFPANITLSPSRVEISPPASQHQRACARRRGKRDRIDSKPAHPTQPSPAPTTMGKRRSPSTPLPPLPTDRRADHVLHRGDAQAEARDRALIDGESSGWKADHCSTFTSLAPLTVDPE